MSLQKITHPASDPALPSFVHPILADVQDDLKLTQDCWDLLRRAKERHLPKEPKEPRTAYAARVMRSSYPSFFRDAVISYAGALSRFELRDPPPLLLENASSIDAAGNSLKAFWMMADANVLKAGGTLLTVDLPRGASPNRTADRALQRRPHLAQVARENVVNWETTTEGGQEVPIAVTILEFAEVRNGKYGVKFEPRYRVMEAGEWRVVRLRESAAGLTEEVVRGDNGEELVGTFEDARGNPLTMPPVVWYSSDRTGFGAGMLPLLSLAHLTLDWFREYSDLKELLHRTAMPVPVRKGMLGAGPKGTTPALILGPNSGIDLPKDGEFSFAEVAGSSLSQHVEHLKHIETLIDRQTLSFLLSGGSDAQKTATQSLLESAQLQASLASMAEGKSSAMESIFRLWGMFTGEAVPAGAGIDLDSGVFDEPVTAKKLTVAQQLYDNSLMTRESVVRLAARAGLLPPGRTVEDELKALGEEDQQRVVGQPPTPGPDDLADGMPFEPGA